VRSGGHETQGATFGGGGSPQSRGPAGQAIGEPEAGLLNRCGAELLLDSVQRRGDVGAPHDATVETDLVDRSLERRRPEGRRATHEHGVVGHGHGARPGAGVLLPIDDEAEAGLIPRSDDMVPGARSRDDATHAGLPRAVGAHEQRERAALTRWVEAEEVLALFGDDAVALRKVVEPQPELEAEGMAGLQVG